MTVVVKNRILVVAGNLSHLDQFVIHGFFKELSASADVSLALPQSEVDSQRWANLPSEFKDSFLKVVPYAYGSKSKSAGSQLGEASTFRFRRLSHGYQLRLRNKYFIGLQIPDRWITVRGAVAIFRNFFEICHRTIKEFPSFARGTRLVFWIWSRVAIKKICKNSGIIEVVIAELPDAILILMQRQAGFVVAAIDSGTKTDTPTFLIPVKWDNASSKSPLVKKPTRMLVYNQQLVKVCLRLHEMSSRSVIPVGSVEVGAKRSTELTAGAKNLVLIGGFSNAANSEPWLNCVSGVLARSDALVNKFSGQVIWRPYPTADSNSLQFMTNFIESQSMIELDQDIKRGISHRAQGISFSDISSAYSNYCDLLDSAVVVVSEGTSAIVDSRARGVPVIVAAFRTDDFVGTLYNSLKYFEHLKGLRTTSGVFIAEDEDQLTRLLVDFLDNPRRIPPDNSGENIFVDHRSYAQRVLDAVSDVLAEKLALQETG